MFLLLAFLLCQQTGNAYILILFYIFNIIEWCFAMIHSFHKTPVVEINNVYIQFKKK